MRGLGDLEAAVMDRLWAWEQPATVREVLDDLRRDRDLAYTTVMTVLDNLHRKGWLTRELDGRAYRYRPVASRQEYSAELMRQALDSSGDNTSTLLHFVGEMTTDEVDAVRRALRSLQRRARRESQQP
ncbi:putative transcriptional regulator [Kribbella sp. VKM Ac-2527]|uniref:Putative transcriptional regulator n=1 Tax=Kribbella caucasensis TaxID=2512215 RepID=A0A4R6JGJ4_9ACTN|nr:BlaI/MecI/CopY family transcriptional regulator [Kribbella sp. VKM Ac-2527]TDO35153.1 putative transcriptional regulator [Kribbella sp. VKM Ac-2527]